MGLTGRQFTIAAGDHEATVVEVGAGLRRYAHRGVDVTFTYGDGDLPPKGCGAVLVPWPNRLRGGRYSFDGKAYQLPLSEPPTGNAIHGLGRWARWVPVRHETSAVTLALDIVPQAGWPFEVRVEVTYALDAVGGLAVTGVARNTGTGRAPFGAGFHPYLSTRGRGIGEVTVKVPARDRIVLDEAKVPVGMQSVAGTPYDLRRGRRLGALRLDDGFTGLSTAGGRGAVLVRTRSGGAQVWFDETFRFVQVFTPDLVAGGLPGVAVEPMTCPADAFNSGTGLIVLTPRDSWTGSWGIQPL
ncbi:MAG TPA: aldose 1-epimerase family protein [Jatrophihabitantaceae bacterium]